MAFNQSRELRNSVFGVQPNIQASAENACGPLDIRAQIMRELERYGAPSDEILDLVASIHERAMNIAELAQRHPDTTAGQLHAMRIDVMTERTIVAIRENEAAIESQQRMRIAELMGAPASTSPDSAITAPEALVG